MTSAVSHPPHPLSCSASCVWSRSGASRFAAARRNASRPRRWSASMIVSCRSVSQIGARGVTHPLPARMPIGHTVVIRPVSQPSAIIPVVTMGPNRASRRVTIPARATGPTNINPLSSPHPTTRASPTVHIVHPPLRTCTWSAACQDLQRRAWAGPSFGLAAPLRPC